MPSEDMSFGRRVLHRAWFSAWGFFESRARDAGLFVAFLIIGGAAYYRLYGWPAAMEQIVPVLIFTVGPMVGLWLLLFVWHLWLAPAALTYEAAARSQDQKNTSPSIPVVKKSVNWIIWRQMDAWTILQLAAILAKEEPTSSATGPEQMAYLKFIKDDVDSGKLPYIKKYRTHPYEGHKYEEKIYDSSTQIKKTDALKWADAHEGFDLSHVR